MAFIGKKPTAAPLTSSDVADGIITNAKLAQDIISADTALAVAPASTDEFLISDAGTLKRIDYSLINNYVLLHDATPTASSNLDISLTGGYYQYSIRGMGLDLSGVNAEIDLYFTTDDFSGTDTALKTQRSYRRLDATGNADDSQYSGYARVVENLGNDSPDSFDFEFTLSNATVTSRSSGYAFWGQSVYGHTDANHAYSYWLSGRSDTTSVVDGIRFAISNSQTFSTTGRIQIYGIGKI